MSAAYTTIKGEVLPLNPKLWRGIRRVARTRFMKDGGSAELFDACWRQYRSYVNGGTDDPQSIDDVTGWLDSIASEKVNNPGSRFYIYG